MTKPFVCWDPAKVATYFNIEASSTIAQLGWDVFRELHVPMKRLEVLGGRLALNTFTDRSHSGEERTFIAEEELLRAVVGANESQNFLISIRGGPGSGKSHLIRWLEMCLAEQDKFLPIAVPRELASVQAVLNRIAKIAGVETSFRQERPDASAGDLATFLISWLRLQVSEEEKPAIDSPAMTELVYQSVDNFLAQRIQRRMGYGAMVTPDLDEVRLSEVASTYLSGDEEYLLDFRLRVDQAYKEAWVLYEVGQPIDLVRFLTDVGDAVQARGKRPVLLMEDVTSFEVLHRDVINFLASLSSGGFIAVLGWTTAYEGENVQTNIIERLALRLSLTDETEGGSAEETYAFQDASDLIELARTYMKAVRLETCARDCGRNTCSAGEEDGLYPFTEAGIKKFYSLLRDRESGAERRTPRLLLSSVMQPLLDAVVTFERFPKLDNVLSVDPIPLPASYRALGNAYLDWAQSKVWFATAETPTSYFEDLGILIPNPEPEASDDEEKSDSPAQRDTRAEQEAEYRAEVKKLDDWLQGANLQSPDSWLNRVGALIDPPVAGTLTPSPGRHVAIEGSAASGTAPFALELNRNAENKDLLQSVARLAVFRSFEANWEAVYVLGRLNSLQKQAERDWTHYLTNEAPIFGLLLEVVALSAAFKGALDNDDSISLLELINTEAQDRGAPRLSAELRDVRTDLEPMSRRIVEGLRAAYADQQDVFDVSLFQGSLKSYRLCLKENRRLVMTTSMRLGNQLFSLDELARADKHLRTFHSTGVQREEAMTRQIASHFKGLPDLGPEFASSMQEFRRAYESWRSPAQAATRWGTYQQALTNFQSLLPTDQSELRRLAEQIEGLHFSEAESSLIRLSRLSAARPTHLRAAAEIALPARELIDRVAHEVMQAKGSDGATTPVDKALLKNELSKLLELVEEIT